jgi:hypothetical protein
MVTDYLDTIARVVRHHADRYCAECDHQFASRRNKIRHDEKAHGILQDIYDIRYNTVVRKPTSH